MFLSIWDWFTGIDQRIPIHLAIVFSFHYFALHPRSLPIRERELPSFDRISNLTSRRTETSVNGVDLNRNHVSLDGCTANTKISQIWEQAGPSCELIELLWCSFKRRRNSNARFLRYKTISVKHHEQSVICYLSDRASWCLVYFVGIIGDSSKRRRFRNDQGALCSLSISFVHRFSFGTIEAARIGCTIHGEVFIIVSLNMTKRVDSNY